MLHVMMLRSALLYVLVWCVTWALLFLSINSIGVVTHIALVIFTTYAVANLLHLLCCCCVLSKTVLIMWCHSAVCYMICWMLYVLFWQYVLQCYSKCFVKSIVCCVKTMYCVVFTVPVLGSQRSTILTPDKSRSGDKNKSLAECWGARH